MDISLSRNIYLSKNQVNYQDITKLEREFEEKYEQLCNLEIGSDSSEYRRLKADLFRIDAEIDSILWG